MAGDIFVEYNVISRVHNKSSTSYIMNSWLYILTTSLIPYLVRVTRQPLTNFMKVAIASYSSYVMGWGVSYNCITITKLILAINCDQI